MAETFDGLCCVSWTWGLELQGEVRDFTLSSSNWFCRGENVASLSSSVSKQDEGGFYFNLLKRCLSLWGLAVLWWENRFGLCKWSRVELEVAMGGNIPGLFSRVTYGHLRNSV